MDATDHKSAYIYMLTDHRMFIMKLVYIPIYLYSYIYSFLIIVYSAFVSEDLVFASGTKEYRLQDNTVTSCDG